MVVKQLGAIAVFLIVLKTVDEHHWLVLVHHHHPLYALVVLDACVLVQLYARGHAFVHILRHVGAESLVTIHAWWCILDKLFNYGHLFGLL